MTYYGRYYKTALNGLLQRINTYMVRRGLCRISLDGHGAPGFLAGQEDALAEEGEGRAAVHLAFEQLGPGVEAFDEA